MKFFSNYSFAKVSIWGTVTVVRGAVTTVWEAVTPFRGTKIGTGRAIPGLEFMPGWMRTPLLHRLLGSVSFLKQRHSFGWVHAFASWLGHFQ